MFAGLSSPIQDQQEFSHRLVFSLNAPASQATSANPARPASPEDPTDPEQSRHPDFTVAPHSPEITTQRATNRAVTHPAPAGQPPAETPADNTPSSQPSAATVATAALHTERTEQQETIQRITRSPIENDPYLILLATHLAQTLEQQRVPAITKLERAVTMELELRILQNGALTRARVVQSTGLSGIDDAAYRAALAASPYPEPKGETTDRFEVTLVFTPKRD